MRSRHTALLKVVLVTAVLALAACQTVVYENQSRVAPKIEEPDIRCPAGVEASDEIIATVLRVDAARVDKLRKARNLSNRDICSMPTRALERALAKLDSPKPDHPGEWAAFRAMQQTDETGTVKPDGLIIGNRQRQVMLANQEAARIGAGLTEPPPIAGISPSGWAALGPGNIGGRVRSILVHPTNTNKMWAGSVSGGIWQTVDGGLNWSPVNDFMGNLSVSSLVMDPSNSNVLYAATGEGFYNADAVRGAGVFKSTDGGVTWGQMASTNPAGGDQWYYVNRLAIHPTNSLIMLAATRSGAYRTIDGGVSWSFVATAGTVGALDIDFDPNDGSKAVIGWNSGQVSYSTSAGATWTLVTLSPSLDFYGRVEVAYAKSSSGTLYASFSATESGGAAGVVYKSVNGGSGWTFVSSPAHLGSQGWYDNAIWVDPTNENHLIVGGLDLWRTTNGGTNWTQISQWWSAPSSPHADHHVIVSSPTYNGTSNRTIFFGNDGGVYKAQDIAAVTGVTTGWTTLNNGLGITQFYGGAGKAAAGGRIVGGTQDNGDLKYAWSGTNWSAVYGGDGGFSAADSLNDNYLYGEYVYLAIHRSTDGGTSATNICNGITEGCGVAKQANFIAPFILDPNNNDRMLGGAKSLWVSNNVKAATPSWSILKPAAGSDYWYYISAIAVAEGNSAVMWVGHNNGQVYKTNNGTAASPTWTPISGVPARPVLRILVDKSDTNRVYVALGGYSSGNLQMTTDGGATWTSISGTLPSVPIRSIVRHPTNPSWLYVGTEVGIFASEDRGSTWNATNDGPANVSVDELFWYSNTQLIAATHGRGMFLTSVVTDTLPSAPTIGTPVPGNSSVSVAFTPGALGSGSLISYWAGCSKDGTNFVYASGNSSPISVTGLVNGFAYNCWAKTQSTVGHGPWSLPSSPVTPAAPPSAPTSVMIAAYPGRVQATFSAPSNNGGSSIVSYTLTCTAAGQPTRTSTGSSSPLSVSGLVSGVSYSCNVTANNAAAAGTASASVTVSVRSVNLTPILMLLLD